MGPPRSKSAISSLLVVALLLLPGPAGLVGTSTLQAAEAKKAKPDKSNAREVRARAAFASGNYEEALELYTALFAETVHPIYQRNIARCYQNLNQPERAIKSFREYLRQGKSITPEERAEVESFIKELDTEVQKAEAAKKPLPPAAPPVEDKPAEPVLVPAPAPVAPIETAETPYYKKAWFWGVVGGVACVAVVGGLWAGGVFSSNDRCTASTCQ
jgi:tetratricopeptide (TPR) repeat protein